MTYLKLIPPPSQCEILRINKLKVPTVIKKMPLFIIQDDQIKFGTKKVNNLDSQGQTILNNLIAP